ncbi:MAG: oligopeptide transporter substrate-binding protein [Symbiobacteriaceae bacterium]|nr:oligopeptide transporter substrate-binding protein [Symbiobacteriaceae bacterium]
MECFTQMKGGFRVKRYLRVTAFLLAAVMLLAAGCSGTKEKAGSVGGIYKVAITEEPPIIDPQLDTTLQVYNLSRNVFSTLVRYKPGSLELEPELLADMPKADADNVTYHFKLRSGVTFHNGAKLTSKDVKATFERMLTPANEAANTWVLAEIKGAQEMLDGKAKELAGVVIKDDLSFDIVLARPFGPFLQNLATAPASIFPADVIKEKGAQFGRAPVGTGPFKLAKWDANQLVKLEKNPNYFEKGLPYLDGVEYRVIPEESTRWMEFQAGTFDEGAPPTAEFTAAKESGDYQFIEYTTLNTWYIAFDQKTFTDKRVREAISLAIDRQKLLTAVWNDQGKLAKQFVTPGIPGAIEKTADLKYDPEKAKQLLKDAGVTNLKIEAWQRGTDKVSDLNLAVQQMLKEVGIDWQVKMVDRATFNDARSKGNIPANQGNWYADYPDPDNYLYTYFHSSQSKGMSINFSDPAVDKILDDARGLADQNKRQKMYQDLEKKLILEEYRIIPLLHQTGYTFAQKWVHGIKGHPTEVEGLRLVWKDAGK